MPIVNTPTKASYEEAAKNALLYAISKISTIEIDLDIYVKQVSDDETEIENIKLLYYEKCKIDIERAHVSASQGCELALKSRICAVSPFLLLLGTEPKFRKKQKDHDFSEFRSIDAVDLPSAVEALCDDPLPEVFIQNYNQLRQNRNKIFHTGDGGIKTPPLHFLSVILDQYHHLWPVSNFSQDLLNYYEGSRQSFFFDGKHATPQMAMAPVLNFLLSISKKSQFSKLFGIPKSKRRYCCLQCHYDGSLGRNGFGYDKFETAHLTEKNKLNCFVCDQQYSVIRVDCPDPSCKGNVISQETFFHGTCHTCGQSVDEEYVDCEEPAVSTSMDDPF